MPLKHKVKKGDCISSIAELYGFFPDNIWHDVSNARIKSLREDPNILQVDDIISIPELQAKTISVASDARHTFVRKGVPETLRICFLDIDDKPRAGIPYQLDVDGKLVSGVTDSDGFLIQPITPMAIKGKILLGESPKVEEIKFDLGTLSPITTTRGVQVRLTHLGFSCGDEIDIVGEKTRLAVRNFQEKFGLKVNGEINQFTRDKLKEVHQS
jgi:peptidoglycan hydrolase-like protein with peptidoglycan-binding domain